MKINMNKFETEKKKFTDKFKEKHRILFALYALHTRSLTHSHTQLVTKPDESFKMQLKFISFN